MTSLPDARRLWAAACGGGEPRTIEMVAVTAALDRRLAETVIAHRASPPTRCAAMDGIAVRAADTAAAPLILAPGAFEPVDTGAPVADRWDAVVVREVVRHRDDGSAEVLAAVAAGADLRPPGEDIAEGAVLLEAGTIIGPIEIAAAVAAGHATLPVTAAPRVAIVPTGDEIVSSGEVMAGSSVVDSNTPMLAALVRLAGCEPALHPVVPDDPARMTAALRDAATGCQLVLIVAGSSGGRRDHTASVIREAGSVVVQGVAMRPGHPVVLGTAHGIPAIGIPGYPIAAAAAFHAFAAPLLAGLRGVPLPLVGARLGDRMSGRVPTRLVPVRLADGIAHPLPGKAGAIRAALGADGMVEVAPGHDLAAGDEVVVQLFRHA